MCAPARAQYEAPPFDSIHLAVPEISQARDWYLENMGGNVGETADRVAFGKWTGDHPLPIQLIFEVSAGAKPSAGSVIDSIGFSFSDLDATVKELQAAGVKIVTPVTDSPTYWKRAVVEDPWGTRLELVEDPDLLGPPPRDPARARSRQASTGTCAPSAAIARRSRAVMRSGTATWASSISSRSRTIRPVPSAGHSIDRLAWGPLDLDKVVNDLKTLGVKFSSDTNPRGYPSCNFVGGDGEGGAPAIRRLYCTQPDQLPHRIVYLEAPDGVRVELVQHLEAGGH